MEQVSTYNYVMKIAVCICTLSTLINRATLFAALNVDYRADNPSIVSFGSPGEITSRAELEGTLSTPAQIEILDNMILDTDDEDVMVFLLATDNSRSMGIIIVDNESTYNDNRLLGKLNVDEH